MQTILASYIESIRRVGCTCFPVFVTSFPFSVLQDRSQNNPSVLVDSSFRPQVKRKHISICFMRVEHNVSSGQI